MKSNSSAVTTLRVDREKLDRFRQIAASEHRTVVQKFRVMIEEEIARHDADQKLAA